MRFEIERKEPAGLKRQLWTFTLYAGGDTVAPPTLRLVRYCIEQRASTRHKWRRDASDYLFSANSIDDWRFGKYIPKSEVPLPGDVRDEAIRYVTGRLTVEIPDGNFEKQEQEKDRYTRRGPL